MKKFFKDPQVLFVLGFLILCAIVSLLVGCSGKDDRPVADTVAPRKSFEVRIFCYEGIRYFGTWNNNAFSDPALTGAVIDKDTLQPEKCDK